MALVQTCKQMAVSSSAMLPPCSYHVLAWQRITKTALLLLGLYPTHQPCATALSASSLCVTDRSFAEKLVTRRTVSRHWERAQAIADQAEVVSRTRTINAWQLPASFLSRLWCLMLRTSQRER